MEESSGETAGKERMPISSRLLRSHRTIRGNAFSCWNNVLEVVCTNGRTPSKRTSITYWSDAKLPALYARNVENPSMMPLNDLTPVTFGNID
ncbi:hypothetical protein TNCV_1464711 [Trichonephila clavipes]|nr:hypothetical protein TNCV_1464711 [Trichonephila clavipes]